MTTRTLWQPLRTARAFSINDGEMGVTAVLYLGPEEWAKLTANGQTPEFALCRKVNIAPELQSILALPEPDWSTAPAWANYHWWSADGKGLWVNEECGPTRDGFFHLPEQFQFSGCDLPELPSDLRLTPRPVEEGIDA